MSRAGTSLVGIFQRRCLRRGFGDNQALQRELLRWLDQLLGKHHPRGDQVSLDGKELLNSQGAAVVSAYSVQSGRWLGSSPAAPTIPITRKIKHF